MLRFFKGLSGSGKSRAMLGRLEKSAADNENVYLIVPEQYSFEAEKLIYDELGFDAANKIKVLSFERLYEEIMSKGGISAGKFASEQMKLLAMSLALDEVRDAVTGYASQIDKPKFAEDMLALFEELSTAGIKISSLEKIETDDEALAEKTKEIVLILTAFDGVLSRLGAEPLSRSEMAARLCRSLEFFNGAIVFIDEFRSFTNSELEFIEELIFESKQVDINLCINDSDSRVNGIFKIIDETVAKLQKICKKNNIPYKTEESFDCLYRFKNAELAHFSEQIFKIKPIPFKEKCENISVMLCPDVYRECDYVCAEIRRLVIEEGYKYGDIAVIGRDLESYSNALEASVTKYELPVFFDERESVLKKALLTLVFSALSATGFNTEQLLNLVKTGFTEIDFEEASELENYCFEWGIRGREWTSDFSYEKSEKEKTVNELRKKLVNPIADFKEKTENACGDEICKALFELLEDYNTPEIVDIKTKNHLSNGREEQARELRQIWDAFVDTLEVMHSMLSGVKITRKRFSELLAALISKSTVSLPPQTIDSVIIGSAEKIRLSAKKVIILIGVNDGVFPPLPSSGPILSNNERKKLSELGIEIFYPNEKTQSEERFIAYKALSAPSEKLIMTCSYMGTDYSEKLPSEIIAYAKKIFGRDVVKNLYELPKSFFCRTKRSAFEYLSSEFNSSDKEFESIYEALRRTDDFSDKLKLLESNNNFSQFRIKNNELMSRLSGDTLTVSATRIQDYYECKFKHFCKYGLGIYPIEVKELSSAVSGSLVHYCLENIIREYGKAIADMSFIQLKNAVSDLINEYVENELGGYENKTEIFKNSLKRIAAQIAKVLSRIALEMKYCEFVPTDFELSIGEGKEIVPKTIISESGKKIMIKGSIDRTDVCEIDGQKYVRVIDYKSGKKKEFSLSNVYYGLNIQLLLYLFIITQSDGKYKGYMPAGALYYSSREAQKSPADKTRHYSKDGLEKAISSYYQMNGLLLKDDKVIAAMDSTEGVFIPKGKKAVKAGIDELESLHTHCEGLIKKIADEFISGNISAVHLTAKDTDSCKYCDYSGICRKQIGVEEESKPILKNEEIFNSIQNKEKQ